MAAKLITPRLALVAILLSTLMVLHECYSDGTSEVDFSLDRIGDDVKVRGPPPKGFGFPHGPKGPKHCKRSATCKHGFCYCCSTSHSKACFKELRFCRTMCATAPSSPIMPNYE